MKNKQFLLIGLLCAGFAGSAMASEETQPEKRTYFPNLTEEQKSIYDYIAYDMPLKCDRWSEKRYETGPLTGSLFNGICEPQNRRADQKTCMDVVTAFANTEHSWVSASNKDNYKHASRITAFEACLRLRDKYTRVEIDQINTFDICHELSGRFGPHDYRIWESRYNEKKQ